MRIALLSSDPEVVFGDSHACPVRLRGLAYALARAGHDITVILSGLEPGYPDPAPELKVRTLRMPVSVREIDWHFSRVQPDIVIERHLPGSLEGARAASEAGVPHLYDLELAARPQALSTSASVRGSLPEALSLSNGAIVSNARAAERLQSLMGDRFPVTVVPNAAAGEFLDSPPAEHVARIEQQLRLAGERPRVAFYGPLVRDCGLLPLVHAMGLMPASRRPRLVVVGDGPERNPSLVAADAAQVGLVLCGRVPQRDAPAYLAPCDVVVVSGDDEQGVPTALLEAMAMERAVIAPATESVRAVARHGHDAHLVPFHDAEALAAALEALLADAPRRGRLGAYARRTVASRHTWDARVEQVLGLADRVLVGSRVALDAWQPTGRSVGADA